MQIEKERTRHVEGTINETERQFQEGGQIKSPPEQREGSVVFFAVELQGV